MTRLSPGTLILGIFAVLFGLVGAFAAKRYLEEGPPPALAEEPAVASQRIVPMASTDLVPGRTLTLGDVALVSLSREQMKKMNLPDQFMTNPAQIIGRTLREPVSRAEAFTTLAFYPEGLGPDVAERLQAGYRAVTIELEEQAAELAMIAAGSTVDVVFRTSPNELGRIPETTVTLLELVEVLAIGEQTFEGARAPRGANGRGKVATVTLAVTPDQASALKVVEGHGSMSLALRGKGDDLYAAGQAPQTLSGLLDLPQPATPFSTQVYRRGRLTTAVFENGQQTVIADSFTGLPVASRSGGSRMTPVSQSLANAGSKDGKKGCGCKSKSH